MYMDFPVRSYSLYAEADDISPEGGKDNRNMTKKCILILLDGLGDRSYPSLGNRTPLQAARTPVLDGLAAVGANGLYHASAQGLALPSENAHFSMFGYNEDEFPGRGALEALGAGISLEQDDVSVLGHLAVVKVEQGNFVLEEGKPECTEEEARELISSIASYAVKGITVTFHRTSGLFGIVKLSGECSRFFTDSDPITHGTPVIDVMPLGGHETERTAVMAAEAMKQYHRHVYRTLKEHPVNIARRKKAQREINFIVTQRPGQLKPVMPFRERYGFNALSIASGIVYHGLGQYLGFDIKKVQDTGDIRADIAERMETAIDLSDRYDFIHVHTKAPDEAAHKKDPMLKKHVIEELDRGLKRAVKDLKMRHDILTVVTADHSTPAGSVLVHSGETVPLILSGEGVRRDGVKKFNEVSAAAGCLGPVRGRELLYLILNHCDRARLEGLRDIPADIKFWPGRYSPMRFGEE